MSTTCNQEDGGTFPFRDEIFRWPIAQLENIDVWELIFEKYLTSPLDRKNLLVASPQFFGPYLEEEKCSVLLGEVLHILHKNNYLNITNTAFLDFRTLSKSCKTAIDTCLQLDNPCFQNLDGIDHEHEKSFDLQQHARCWQHSLHISSRNVEHCVSIFRNGVDLRASNPILLGYLRFSTSCFSARQGVELFELKKNFKTILATFGSQIYHFEFHQDRDEKIEDLLIDFLGMMPNLQTLIFRRFRSYMSEAKQNFFQLDTRLPNLDHLNVLKIEDAPDELVSALISKYGRHLQKISIKSVSEYNHKIGMLSPAIRLVELSLPIINTVLNNGCYCSIGEYIRESLKHTNSLRCLSLGFCIVDTFRENTFFQELTFALRDIFENGKLHTLNLTTKSVWDSFTNGFNFYDNNVRLKLPFLRRLWIHNLSFPMGSIDCILGVSDSLEEFVLNMREAGVIGAEKNIIQFCLCWNRMEESNVWELMPKLQKVTIRRVDGFYSDTHCKEYIRSRPSKYPDLKLILN